MPGQLAVITNIASEQKITQTTTTTTTTTNTQVWEIDGTAAQLGTVHAVVPVAGFDQSEGYAGRLLEQVDAASGHVAPWVQGWGQRNRTDGGDPLTGAAPGDSRSAYGFDVGASAALVPMLRIGASIDHGRTDIVVPSVGERARVEITEAAAFGRVGGARGPFMAFGGGYGWGDDTTYVTPGGASQTATASERLHLGWATGALGWRIGGREAAITPSIGATFTRVTLDGFSEQGSTFGLRGSRASVARTLAWAGLDAAGAVGSRLTAHVWARGAHYGGDLAPVLGVAFASDPTNATPLAIAAPRDARWGADLGAGIACRIAPHLEAFLATAADLRGSGRTLEASGGLRMTL